MTTIVIDERTRIGKLILDMIHETNCGKILEEKKRRNQICGLSHIPNAETIKAIEEAETGMVNEYNSTSDLFKSLDKKCNV